MSSASRIQEAALARFARQGFDATSMNEIAADAGLKKPSVYGHFRNKDELYLSLVPLLIESELAFAASAIRGGKTLRKQLYAYLKGIRRRYQESHAVQFWMGALVHPPAHIHDQVIMPMHDFMDALEATIVRAIASSELAGNAAGLSCEDLARAVMSMIDSLQSELIYGGPVKFRRRLESVWAVFEAATRLP
ncbi:MAG: TetR/AcrR family transcriptional regulator [Pseudomonas sp.]|uniref:TetR/AcrR family transcriptional regulator n=1 Tax=Pseudomonas sp. TaxID=306 RepID=UPI003D0AEED8